MESCSLFLCSIDRVVLKQQLFLLLVENILLVGDESHPWGIFLPYVPTCLRTFDPLVRGYEATYLVPRYDKRSPGRAGT